MCGISVFPADGDKELIVSILSNLEKVRGGNGCGVGLFKTPNLSVFKGANWKYSDCIDSIYKEDSTIVEDTLNNQVLFHARRNSKGINGTFNNQPFPISMGEGLVHNGTWYDHSEWAKALIISRKMKLKNLTDFSDSKVIAMVIRTLRDINFLDEVGRGVFVTFNKKHTILRLYTGDFEAAKINGKFYYATEFKEIYDEHYSFKNGTIAILKNDEFNMVSGDDPDKKEHKVSVINSCYNKYLRKHREKRNSGNKVKPNKRYESEGWKIIDKDSKVTSVYSPNGILVYQCNPKGDVFEVRRVVPDNIKHNRCQLNAQELKIVSEFMDTQIVESCDISHDEDKIPSRRGVPIYYRTFINVLTEDQLILYHAAVTNFLDPTDRKTYIEYSGTSRACTIKGSLVYLLRNKEGLTVEDVYDYMSYICGVGSCKKNVEDWDLKHINELVY